MQKPEPPKMMAMDESTPIKFLPDSGVELLTDALRDSPLFKKIRDEMHSKVSAQAAEALKNPLIAAQILYACNSLEQQRVHFEELQHVDGKEKLAMTVKLSQSTRHDYQYWLKFDNVEISKELAKYEK